MPIKGLTDKGLSFPQIGRIKKGEMIPVQGKQGVMRPVDLDYFKVEFADTEEGEALAAKFVAAFGPEPKSIDIFLPFNEIDQMWDGYLEAYTASRLLARSDGPAEEGGVVLFRCDGKTGETIVRNGENLETGLHEPHPVDNIAGKDYKGKPVYYNPIGRLKVIVPDLEEAAYLLFTTGSWNDIRFISQQLAGLKELNQDMIKGVPLKLIRSDHEVMAPIDGKKTRVTKSLVSIKADPEWVKARIQEDKKMAFPDRIIDAMLTPGDQIEETEERALAELTHPDQWGEGGQTVITLEEPPEAQAIDPEPVPDESGRPYTAEEVREGILAGVAGYEERLKKNPEGYAVMADVDRKVIASIINASMQLAPDDSGPRYAVFKYLLGKGKGSTKEWSAYEIGTIKHLWLEVTTFGDVLGEVQAQELQNVWIAAQEAQGQQKFG